MKNLLLPVFLLVVSFSCFSQADSLLYKNNIEFNPIQSTLFTDPGVSYERFIGEGISLEAGVNIKLSQPDTIQTKEHLIIPNTTSGERMAFSGVSGFFALKYFFAKRFYFSPEVLIQSWHFYNRYEIQADGSPAYLTEKQFNVNPRFIMGKRFNIYKSRTVAVFIDVFAGMGLNFKNVEETENNGFPVYPSPVVPTINTGVKLGFGWRKKK